MKAGDKVYVDSNEYAGVLFSIIEVADDILLKPVSLPAGKFLPEWLQLRVRPDLVIVPVKEQDESDTKRMPSHVEVKELLSRYNLTSAKAGHIIDVDARTIRRYTGDPTKTGAKQMPWSSWTLLRLIVGDVTPETIRSELDIDDVRSQNETGTDMES